MTKSELIAKAGTQRALARVLGLSAQAINQWPERVPELRIYQLRAKKPHWFRKPKAAASVSASEAA